MTLVEANAYDSRVRCMVEACLRPKVPGAGEASRLAFFFDTGTRRTHVYLDKAADAQWKPIDLDRPVILAKIPSLNFELRAKIPELTAVVRAFEDFPRDPRAEAEVGSRRAGPGGWVGGS